MELRRKARPGQAGAGQARRRACTAGQGMPAQARPNNRAGGSAGRCRWQTACRCEQGCCTSRHPGRSGWWVGLETWRQPLRIDPAGRQRKWQGIDLHLVATWVPACKERSPQGAGKWEQRDISRLPMCRRSSVFTGPCRCPDLVASSSGKEHKLRGKAKSATTGNRTPASCVTGRDTNHYTIATRHGVDPTPDNGYPSTEGLSPESCVRRARACHTYP